MREDLERLAREAGLVTADFEAAGPQLERFAQLVREDECERCAAQCSELAELLAKSPDVAKGARACAVAISNSAPRGPCNSASCGAEGET